MTVLPYTVQPRQDTGLYNAKVGIWLFLASEVMLFGALFSSYVLIRVNAPEGTWPHNWLNIPLGTLNTMVLITSSVTVVMAWASLKLNQFSKFKLYHACTILLAVTFIAIKSFEYHDKFTHYDVWLNDGRVANGHLLERTKESVILHGYYLDLKAAGSLAAAEAEPPPEDTLKEIRIPTSQIQRMENFGPWHNDYLALYFTMTALHALHVIGGALVIGFLWGPGSKMWKTDPERYTNRIEISGLFWHFVDLVWIFLFPVLYLL